MRINLFNRYRVREIQPWSADDNLYWQLQKRTFKGWLTIDRTYNSKEVAKWMYNKRAKYVNRKGDHIKPTFIISSYKYKLDHRL